MEIAPQPDKCLFNSVYITVRGVCLLFCLAVGLHVCFGCMSLVLAEEYEDQGAGILSLRYIDNRLTVETTAADLDKVLQELSLITGVTIVSDAPVTGQLTLRINDYPLDKAMRKILRGKDISFIYAAPVDVPDDRCALKEVRIYLGGGDSGQGLNYSYNAAKKEKKKSYSKKTRRKKTSHARRPRPKGTSQSNPRQLYSDLMEGNINDLEELGEWLKEENPGTQDQVDQFMEYLEEAKDRAEETGQPFPELEGLEGMGMIMHQMFKGKNKAMPGGGSLRSRERD